MSFLLEPLEYEEKDLEPYMSSNTVKVHYSGHHRGYVDKLNKLLFDTPYADMTLKEVIIWSGQKNRTENDMQIFNNASQHFNHAFFWKSLTSKKLLITSHRETIFEKSFGSLAEFKDKFSIEALKLFGSGWTWLVKNKEQELQIINFKNADSPLLQQCTPLLCCDVWEHSYYLDCKNESKIYLENFWKIINWSFVEKNLLQ